MASSAYWQRDNVYLKAFNAYLLKSVYTSTNIGTSLDDTTTGIRPLRNKVFKTKIFKNLTQIFHRKEISVGFLKIFVLLYIPSLCSFLCFLSLPKSFQ